MKDPRDIIKRPIITENTMNLISQKNIHLKSTLMRIKQK